MSVAVASRSVRAQRHAAERRAVLARHPEVSALSGPNPLTTAALPVLLALHWGMAWLVSGANLMIVFAAAFCYGQVVLHAAGGLVHETAHRLVFRKRGPKLAFDLGLEVILASYGRQLTYQHEHVSSHHRFQGVYARDYELEDICAYLARRELRAARAQRQHAMTVLTMILHLLPLGFLFADKVTMPLYRVLTGRKVEDAGRDIRATKPTRAKVALFVLVSLASNAALFLIAGVWGLLYHVWALSLFLGKWGITNLGQSLSEHPDHDVERPTRSTYGWINRLLFNTGYHHEHHVFTSVAWTRLPQLTAIAPEVFNLASPDSYAALWWRHVRNDFSPSRWQPEVDAHRVERCER